MKEKMRTNLVCEVEDWKEFRNLAEEYGFTQSAIFTKMFYKALSLMREGQPLWDEEPDELIGTDEMKTIQELKEELKLFNKSINKE